MKSHIKLSILLSLFAVPALTGCYEDKGHYDYTEEEVITVEFPENIACMEGGEFIEFDPVVTSNLCGEITDDNSDYEFGCRLMYPYTDENGVVQSWYDIDSLKTKAINIRASFAPGSFTAWYTVKNLKTNVLHSYTTVVKIISSTTDGWIVISNSGADKRGRVDMIFRNAKSEEIVYPDIRQEKTPDMRDLRQIYVNETKMNTGSQIWLSGGNGTWLLNGGTLQTDDSYNIKNIKFATPNIPGEIVWWYPVNFTDYGHYSQVCISSEGNAYGIYQWVGNTCFEFPMNTDTPQNAPTFKVAPVCASSEVRPGNSDRALFYDTTNKRFVGFVFTNSYGDSEILHPLVHDSESGPEKFSYKTGMDFVHMEGTRFSDGVVYTVLQDNAGKRHIYGIQCGTKFQQEALYTNIADDNFHHATDYAFHSQYPFVCYCRDNKFYCYNYVSQQVTDVVTLDGEQTTMVKFPLYRAFALSRLIYQTQEFLAKQFQLVVGSSTGGVDSGIIRFYDVDASGKFTELVKYTGFGECPVDITYRERVI